MTTYKVICMTSSGAYVLYHGHSAELALALQARLIAQYNDRHRGRYYGRGLNVRTVARDKDGNEQLMSGFEIGGRVA